MSGIRKKNIELLSASRRMDEKRREALLKIIYLAAAPVILSGVILCSAFIYQARIVFYKSETEKITEFLDSEETRKRSERTGLLQEKIDLFHEYKENSELAGQYMASLISVTQDKMYLIKDKVTEGMIVSQVSFNDNHIILTGSAEDYKQISDYIKRLEETEAFFRILYDGFTRNSADLYEFRIACYLS